MVLKRIIGWSWTFGGEEHTGWLPPDAATPLPTPIQHLLLDLEIDGNEREGYLIIGRSQDGSFEWDTWYKALAEALAAANADFGISADDWYGA
jgi:hypothetical protein